MWWGKSSDKPAEAAPKEQATPVKDVVNKAIGKAEDTAQKTFDETKLPERKQLPPQLKKIMDKADKEENFYDELVDGYAPPSTDSNVRYAAYAARFRTILISAHRYVAYTSDIGESFRPVAHPWLIKGAYGVSWAYILGDVSYEGYKAYWHNQRILNPSVELSDHAKRIAGLSDAPPPTEPGKVVPLEDYRVVMLQRGIFQSVASMGLPAFTIHSVVRYSGRALKDAKNKTIRTWGPIGLGLAVVPFLPTLFDKPVENAVEFVFHKAFATVGGQKAVGETPQIGREHMLSSKPKEGRKEKEL